MLFLFIFRYFDQIVHYFVAKVGHLSLDLQLILEPVYQVVIKKAHILKPIFFECRGVVDILVQKFYELRESFIP